MLIMHCRISYHRKFINKSSYICSNPLNNQRLNTLKLLYFHIKILIAHRISNNIIKSMRIILIVKI